MSMTTTHTVMAGFALAFGFSTAYTVVDVTEASPIILRIAKLEYTERDGVGYVTQQIVSENGRPVPAEWFVQVSKVNSFGVVTPVCSGANKPGKPGLYNGDVDTYTVDVWAGDDCPDVLTDIHRAEVGWKYKSETGLLVTLGGTLQGADFVVDGDG